MSNKSFSVRQFDIIGDSGNPKITSTEYIELNTPRVAISTDVTVGGIVRSDLTLTNHSVTSAQLNVTGIGTITHSKASELHVTGVGTIGYAVASNLNVNGIATITSLNVTGVSTVGSEVKVVDTFLKPQAVGLGTTTATGRDAGISTATGTLIYVPPTGVQVYTGDIGGWKTIANTNETPPTPPNVQGSGGFLYEYNNHNIHVFESTQPFTTPSSFNKTVNYTIIGGGGGSNYDGGGGGGAGGWMEGSEPVVGSQTIVVTVGAGGDAGIEGSTPGTGPSCTGGQSSVAFPGGTVTAAAGGGGAYSGTGGAGGSAGGGRGGQGVTNGGTATGVAFPGTPGTTTPSAGWGYPGGNGVNPSPGGGGGGASGAGDPGNSNNGRGGSGIFLHSIYRDPQNPYGYAGPGSSDFWFAGGGGGGSYPKSNSGKGAGGGSPDVASPYCGAGRGQGNENPGSYQNGQDNSGSGGGGSTAGPSPRNGGNGGSGIVFLAYPTS